MTSVAPYIHDDPAAYTWLGLSMLVVGVLSVILVMGGTVAPVSLAGLFLAVIGVARLVMAWNCRDWRGFLPSVLNGLVAVLLGLLAALSGAGWLVALAILADGGYALILPASAPKLHRRKFVVLTAATGVVLGLVSLFAAASAATVLMALGLQLLVGGWMFLMISGSPMFQDSL